MSILIFVVILLVLVLVHEWGHFFTAKKFGIRVDEFGFGFPPRALKLFKKGETLYTLNWLPIGGFVKIFGENPDDENTNGPDKDRSFVNKPRWQQAIVLFAGVFMNFILAWVLFSVGLFSGMPMSVQNAPESYNIQDSNLMIISISPSSPAEKAGLESRDKIVYLGAGEDDFIEAPNITPEVLKDFIITHPKNEIEIGYLRGKDNVMNIALVTPELKDEKPLIGVSSDVIGIVKLPLLSSFVEGMNVTLSATKDTAFGLYSLIANGIKGTGSFDSVTGPVGIVKLVGSAASFGFIYLLSFAAYISINLAIINLVPFPALDGGRLLFLLIEKIKGSRINAKFANYANMIGFGILILLMVVVTYHDIVKLVK
ncbi:MAG: Peptidase protein [Patescibacteria group bacterium]|nr:Peptidase protein [Patescibacteria group bacterium]